MSSSKSDAAKARAKNAFEEHEKIIAKKSFFGRLAAKAPNNYEEMRKLVDPSAGEMDSAHKLEVLGRTETVLCVLGEALSVTPGESRRERILKAFNTCLFFDNFLSFSSATFNTFAAKYVTTLLIMLALAVYYSVYQTQVVGTFNPKGSLINYRAKVVEHPTLKCGCDVQTIPFRDFAVPTVAVNRACDWVEADLNATTSSCKELKLVGYCVSVRDACRQSKATVAWVLDEFNNSVVSSTSLIQEDAIKYSTSAAFESNFKVGELIAAAPKMTVKAWAAANMPRIMRLVGGLTTRVKAQTKKVRYLMDNSDNTFATSCALASPLICKGSFSVVDNTDPDTPADYDYALNNDGDVPVSCVRSTAAPSCTQVKVANGVCNPDCMSPECLFDGGDCANNQIMSDYPREIRQSFTLLDARLTADSTQADYEASWLDTTPDAFIDDTRRRCDESERWIKTDTLPETVDLYSSKFGGYDFSSVASEINVAKTSATYPFAADGTTKVEFRASLTLGCDQYEKELKENLFEFYTVAEFKYFMQQMRTLAGSDVSSSVPLAWTCDPSYYNVSDGCDCACGAWDPDCADASLEVFGCATPTDVCADTNGGTCQAGTGVSSSRRRLTQVTDADTFREYLDPTKALYKITGFDYLENFAASLMETHTNLDTAIDKLFVDRKSLEVDYDKYFVACKVTSCTYTYMSASSFAGLVAVVIGLLGGIQNATSAVFGVVYSQMRGIIVPKDAPESEETEPPATETPATEWAQSRKNPV